MQQQEVTMYEFSIELASERIDDKRSREYFAEVLGSFINENYRSAVVMLWSVVISDFVFKLQTLSDLYQDETAEKILKSIREQQENSPTSSNWEKKLLEDIRKKTNLLEIGDYQNLLALQGMRHLSAHPVLSETNILYAPNKETVRSHIRNALEAVLLKPPIFTKKIINQLVTDLAEKKELLPDLAEKKELLPDLAEKKELLPDKKSLQPYLENKYYNNLRPSTEEELFKTLWKFCFCLSNSDTNANRDINVRALALLYIRNQERFRNCIQNYPEFSSISTEFFAISALITFISEHIAIYQELNEPAKILIENFAKKNANLFSKAIFLSTNMKKHLIDLGKFEHNQLFNLTTEEWAYLIDTARDVQCLPELHCIAINLYRRSPSFNGAGAIFTKFLEPCINEFNKESIEKLLSGIEENDQTYCRGNSRRDHQLIADIIKNQDYEITISDYSCFTRSLPE
ncbi:MAG: hypothetical protein ACI8ZB_005300 [Desulforhopalus sp.]|jgi:hypothetical protein